MNRFSAKEPSLGYHYQVRYALYLLLKAKDKESPFVRLENLDDVEVVDVNKNELHQTKFHNKKAANLTDASVDIWKTIRVWGELALTSEIDLKNVVLVLVTTSETSKGASLHDLKTNGKTDETVKGVIKKFDTVSETSKNKTLKDAFAVYKKLSATQKENLVKSFSLVDNALGFDELKNSIYNELQFAFLPSQIDTAFSDIEGWWYNQCIQHLEGKTDNISLENLTLYIHHLRDKYKTDSLPIDKLIRAAEVSEDDYEDMLFVEQLKKIKIGNAVIGQAKRDFFRASEQRSKWLREKLLHPEEEIDYDYKLKDDWSGKFAVLQDEVNGLSNEDASEKCKSFYTNYYAASCPPIFIRPRITESFLVRGSCQMLADKKDIVWHPNLLKSK